MTVVQTAKFDVLALESVFWLIFGDICPGPFDRSGRQRSAVRCIRRVWPCSVQVSSKDRQAAFWRGPFHGRGHCVIA